MLKLASVIYVMLINYSDGKENEIS